MDSHDVGIVVQRENRLGGFIVVVSHDTLRHSLPVNPDSFMRKYRVLALMSPRLITEMNRLSVPISVDPYAIDRQTRLRHFKSSCTLLLLLRKYDGLLVFNAGVDVTLIAFLARVLWRHRVSIFFYDTNLQAPRNIRTRIKCLIKAFLFSGVDKFLCMQKDTGGYESFYKIPRGKFVYIPFKANNVNILDKFVVTDGPYVLAAGASRRDYRTFIHAIEILGHPTIIVLPEASIAQFHNTDMDGRNLPQNVTVVRHNFEVNSWNTFLANARVVVVPIQQDAIQPAGISVYLEAMALGKPVVITDGPSTRDILTGEEAEIVPAADPGALAKAISRLWDNEGYRKLIGGRGREYALSLGGERRLLEDILKVMVGFLKARNSGFVACPT